jgi:hypothetical protein
MATVTLSVPSELLRRASARLGKNRGDVQDFLLRSLQALSMEGQPVDAKTTAKLIEGIESPLLKPDAAHWRAKLKRYDDRQGKRRKGG